MRHPVNHVPLPRKGEPPGRDNAPVWSAERPGFQLQGPQVINANRSMKAGSRRLPRPDAHSQHNLSGALVMLQT